jgi:hypothetical protein
MRRIAIATAFAVTLAAPSFAQQPKEKDKQEPTPALADSQQGFSFDYCRELLAKSAGDAASRANEAKIKTCMTTGKVD